VESTHDRARSLNESRGRSISPPNRASTELTTERDCALDHAILCNRLLGLPWGEILETSMYARGCIHRRSGAPGANDSERRAARSEGARPSRRSPACGEQPSGKATQYSADGSGGGEDG
jgi:hypothetical protein